MNTPITPSASQTTHAYAYSIDKVSVVHRVRNIGTWPITDYRLPPNSKYILSQIYSLQSTCSLTLTIPTPSSKESTLQSLPRSQLAAILHSYGSRAILIFRNMTRLTQELNGLPLSLQLQTNLPYLLQIIKIITPSSSWIWISGLLSGKTSTPTNSLVSRKRPALDQALKSKCEEVIPTRLRTDHKRINRT